MKQVAIVIFLLFLLCGSVLSVDIYESQAKALGADRLELQLPSEAQEMLRGIDVNDGSDLWNKIVIIFKRALQLSAGNLVSSIRCGAKILLTAMLCAVVGRITDGISNRAVVFVGIASIGALCFTDFRSCLQSGLNAIEQLDVFTKLLLPVMAGAAAAAGGITASSSLYSLAVLFFQLLISAVKQFIVPIICIILAVSATQCAAGETGLGRFRSFLTSAVKNFLRIMTFAFSVFLSFTGVISGKADSVAMKATKLAAGTVVPVVGSMISDASETILVSAGLLRDSVGVFGMFAVLSILIVPFLRTAIHYVVLQIVTQVCSFVGLKEHVSLVSDITSCVGLLAGVTCCCGLFAFVSCVCFMKTGVL